jgi:simple sugar transport system permease protein/ribose transport system permease protein
MAAADAVVTRRPRPRGLTARRAVHALLALAAGVLVAGAATTDGFLTVDNLRAILASMGVVGIVAVGMTAIVLGGSLFSLSLGTTVAVSAMAFLFTLRLGTPAALVLTVALGAVVCGVQGGIVGAVGANPIIVTIAAGALQKGVATLLSGGASVYPPDGASFRALTHTVLGLPISIYALVVVALLVELVLRRTRFGHELLLVGESPRAARTAALPVGWVTAGAFALAGACCGLAGVFVGALNGSATLQLSGTYTYDAIAAVLVGGTAITGGSGSALRTVGGALVIATVSDMLLLRGYSTGAQIAVKGAIVLIVVVALHLRDTRRA